jgi:hypothetical protein
MNYPGEVAAKLQGQTRLNFHIPGITGEWTVLRIRKYLDVEHLLCIYM